MLTKCDKCKGTKRVRHMGFVHSECKACDSKGMVEQPEPKIEPEIKPEVKANAKKATKGVS